MGAGSTRAVPEVVDWAVGFIAQSTAPRPGYGFRSFAGRSGDWNDAWPRLRSTTSRCTRGRRGPATRASAGNCLQSCPARGPTSAASAPALLLVPAITQMASCAIAAPGSQAPDRSFVSIAQRCNAAAAQACLGMGSRIGYRCDDSNRRPSRLFQAVGDKATTTASR
jgi:hypothetical protein